MKHNLVLIVMLLISFSAEADIVKWTDSNGVVNYSDVVPEDSSGSPITLKKYSVKAAVSDESLSDKLLKGEGTSIGSTGLLVSKEELKDYLSRPNPKAMAVSSDMVAVWYGGTTPSKSVMELCSEKSKKPCELFAVDNKVVSK